jgi:hypothetical protein
MFRASSSHGQRLILVVIAALTLAALACSSGSSATEAPAKQPEATEAPATEAPATEDANSASSGGGGSVSLDIENTGSTDVCEVYIALIDDKSWGKDQLGEKKILPGATFTLTDIPEGTYDLQALDCEGNVVARASKQELSGTDFTWTIESDTVTLTINNKSDSIGCKVYIAEPNDKYWGPNIVDEGETIDPGSTYTITGITPGTYDIHAETCSGNYFWDWEGIDLSDDFTLNMNN